jgi:hypothetical protein
MDEAEQVTATFTRYSSVGVRFIVTDATSAEHAVTLTTGDPKASPSTVSCATAATFADSTLCGLVIERGHGVTAQFTAGEGFELHRFNGESCDLATSRCALASVNRNSEFVAFLRPVP